MGVPAVVTPAGRGRRAGHRRRQRAGGAERRRVSPRPRSRRCATTRCGGAGIWRALEQQRGLSWDAVAARFEALDPVTRRLLQAIAGARHGGAETFFVRLAAALQRAGETQRVLIRRDPRALAGLRAAGVAVAELAFGGPFDLATRLAFRREIAALAAGYRADLDEPGDPALPARRFRACCPARGVLRFEILPALRSSDRQHPRHRRLCRRPRLAARADRLPAEFRARCARRGAAGARRAARGEAAAGAGARPPASEQGVRPAARGAGRDPRGAVWRSPATGRCARRSSSWPAVSGSPTGSAFSAGARMCRQLLGERRSSRLPVAARAARQCRDRGLVGRTAGRRHRQRRAGRADRGRGQRASGAASRSAAAAARGTCRRDRARLCRDPALRARLGQAGRRAYEAEFTEAAVVARYRGFFDRLALGCAASPG